MASYTQLCDWCGPKRVEYEPKDPYDIPHPDGAPFQFKGAFSEQETKICFECLKKALIAGLGEPKFEAAK